MGVVVVCWMLISGKTHVLNVFGEVVHLRVVRLLKLFPPLVLPHGRRLPLVDEDLGVLGVLLA